MKKTRLIFITLVILILTGILSSCIGGGAATTVQIWPGLTIDENNQIGYVAYGNHVYAVNLTNGTETWRFPAEPVRNLGLSTPPSIGADGSLVVGGYNHILYNLDIQSGAQRWVNEDATNRYYAGALAKDGSFFAPNIDHSLYTVDQNGKLVWKFETEEALWGSPVTDGKTIYLAGMDHSVYALDPKTGKVVWKTEDVGGSFADKPALSADGILYIGNFNNEMLAIDAATGKIIWRTPVSGWVYGSPVLDQGMLYFGDLAGTFYALDAASGQIKWQRVTTLEKNVQISGSPAILDDTVYFGTQAGVVYALDIATGAERWNSLQKPFGNNNGKTTLGKIYGPLQAAGDIIYITPTGVGPLIFAIDKDGNLKWQPFTPAK
jgi:outer membrane protein assembly factor BamB